MSLSPLPLFRSSPTNLSLIWMTAINAVISSEFGPSVHREVRKCNCQRKLLLFLLASLSYHPYKVIKNRGQPSITVDTSDATEGNYGKPEPDYHRDAPDSESNAYRGDDGLVIILAANTEVPETYVIL